MEKEQQSCTAGEPLVLVESCVASVRWGVLATRLDGVLRQERNGKGKAPALVARCFSEIQSTIFTG